jgi:lipoprotein NlpD
MCCLLLGGCAETAAEGPQTYIVRPQDTLYSIAWRHDLDYRDLARWNYLGADFRISVGQVLVLGPGRAPPAEPAPPGIAPPAPESPRVSKPRPLPAPPSSSAPPVPATGPVPSAAPPPATAPPPTTAPPPPSARAAVDAAPYSSNGALKWVWPTDRSGAPRPVPGGGILLSGRLGQDVRAASAGRVVYTGSGMRGYGNLIIIKHADSLLSAYAHNREMLVHEGQEVATGQVIAHMGEGGPQTPVLYFEIRQNGRPVDPLPFLPKAK